jgi:hypothetical protein
VKTTAILIATFILAACSGARTVDEKYRPLGSVVQEANRYYQAELQEHPDAAVNGESYMSVLKIQSPAAFYSLEDFRVDVRPWRRGPKSGFSVALYEGVQAILLDCSDTPGIDSWRYNAPKDPHVLIIEPPCGSTFEFIDE